MVGEERHSIDEAQNLDDAFHVLKRVAEEAAQCQALSALRDWLTKLFWCASVSVIRTLVSS
jgi:hypothetical protein